VLGTDLIAEEARCLAGSVRDQRLGLRQLQLQFLMQERRDLRLDVLSLASGASEPQQPVVGLCRGPGYADLVGGLPGQVAVRRSWVGIILRGRL
jgi:hypothetical protein